jgi:nitrate reductase gamma subunit
MSIISLDLYSFLRGPAFVFSLFIFAAGCLYRVRQFVRLTRKISNGYGIPADTVVDNSSILFRGRSRLQRAVTLMKLKLQRTIFGSNPVMGVVSAVFHILLFVTPIFLAAHNILADQSMGISLFSFNEHLTDTFTIIIIAIGVFFFLRRIFVPRVRMLTALSDYLVLLLVIAPFITAFVAYHQFFYYRTFLFMHMITGEIAIMAVPFTSLGHMPFFIFSRFFIGGEYNWKPGNRAW